MRSRFQHIAVPVDFTARNRGALDVAFELASVNRARVTLLHVVETLEIDLDGEVRRFYDRLEQRARMELDPLRQRFEDSGLSAHASVLLGRRAAQIVEFAREHGVDLLVLSSHPIDETQPLKSMATISYQVSIAAPCSVLLVKTPDAPVHVSSSAGEP
jgi:nucleotide-binding universal stress UspA family protein